MVLNFGVLRVGKKRRMKARSFSPPIASALTRKGAFLYCKVFNSLSSNKASRKGRPIGNRNLGKYQLKNKSRV